MKDVQATGEAFSPHKRTSSTPEQINENPSKSGSGSTTLVKAAITYCILESSSKTFYSTLIEEAITFLINYKLIISNIR
jgi:hypothetical protein